MHRKKKENKERNLLGLEKKENGYNTTAVINIFLCFYILREEDIELCAEQCGVVRFF